MERLHRAMAYISLGVHSGMLMGFVLGAVVGPGTGAIALFHLQPPQMVKIQDFLMMFLLFSLFTILERISESHSQITTPMIVLIFVRTFVYNVCYFGAGAGAEFFTLMIHPSRFTCRGIDDSGIDFVFCAVTGSSLGFLTGAACGAFIGAIIYAIFGASFGFVYHGHLSHSTEIFHHLRCKLRETVCAMVTRGFLCTIFGTALWASVVCWFQKYELIDKGLSTFVAMGAIFFSSYSMSTSAAIPKELKKICYLPFYVFFNEDLPVQPKGWWDNFCIPIALRLSSKEFLIDFEKHYMTHFVKNRNVSIAILGQSGAGKTSLCRNLHSEPFLDQHKHTESVDVHSTTVETDDSRWRKWDRIPFTKFMMDYMTNWYFMTQNKSENIILRIWDFAGDIEYYATHRIFLQCNSIYLLVINLSVELNDIVDKNMKWTTKQFVAYWLNCIYAYSERTCQVLLIGTHKDKVDPEKIQKTFEKLKEFVSGKPYEHLLLDYLAVANPDTYSNDIRKIKEKIIDLTINLHHIVKEIPAIFFNLREKIQQNEHYSLSREEFDKLCLHIDSDFKIKEVLLCLQEAGDLFYFSDMSSERNILLKPQWLSDRIKEITNYDHVDKIAFDFRKEGFIPEQTLNNVWSENKEFIVQILEHYGVLFPFDQMVVLTNTPSTHNPQKGYLCPLFMESGIHDLPGTFYKCPLVLLPEGGFIEFGATAHLIAKLSQGNEWLISGLKKDKAVLEPRVVNGAAIPWQILLHEAQCHQKSCLKLYFNCTIPCEDLSQIRSQCMVAMKDVTTKKILSGVICQRCEEFIEVLDEYALFPPVVRCRECHQDSSTKDVEVWYRRVQRTSTQTERESIKKIIDDKRPYLIKKLTLDPLLIAELKKRGAIVGMVEQKLNLETMIDGEKVDVLLDHIRKNPVERFTAFIDALRHSNWQHIIGELHR